MKIVNNVNQSYPFYLHQAEPGDCVEFETNFHQKHEPDAKFLVLRVPSEYIRHEKRNRDGEFRIMVSNLATGDTSLITTERWVRIIDAEVVLK